jgi:hypothetical protein
MHAIGRLALVALGAYLDRTGLQFLRSYVAYVADWGVVADVRTPANWYSCMALVEPALPDPPQDHQIDPLSHRRARARMLVKVHELNVMASPLLRYQNIGDCRHH